MRFGSKHSQEEEETQRETMELNRFRKHVDVTFWGVFFVLIKIDGIMYLKDKASN